MKRFKFNHVIMAVLIILFLIFFALQQIIFHDIRESGFLFFQDLMFLPLEILLVTFILDKILQMREKQKKLEHMNIVISAFFSECGSDVIKKLNSCVSNLKKVRELLNMTAEWENGDFDKSAKGLRDYTFIINDNRKILADIKSLLLKEKIYLLQMFNNPNLLEHDTFTDMLWALFHLLDELENRDTLHDLPETDMEHLSGDIARAYAALVYEWVFYMKHLKKRYPYLYSLAVKKSV